MPGCAATGPFPLVAEAVIDQERLGSLAFASRKAPELMHHRLVICTACDLLFADPAPGGSIDCRLYGRRVRQRRGSAVGSSAPTRPPRRAVARRPAGRGRRARHRHGRGLVSGGTSCPRHAPCRRRRAVRGARGGGAAGDPAARFGSRCSRPADFAPASLALITCFQTLEHVRRPPGAGGRGVLPAQARRRLVAVDHDRLAWSARLLGYRSPIYDVEHLQLFSPRSGRTPSRGAGFVAVRSAFILNGYPLHYS